MMFVIRKMFFVGEHPALPVQITDAAVLDRTVLDSMFEMQTECLICSHLLLCKIPTTQSMLSPVNSPKKAKICKFHI